MTFTEMQTLVGKIMHYYPLGYSDIYFNVTIVDCKLSYGKTQVKIVPESGGKAKWVMYDNLVEFSKG